MSKQKKKLFVSLSVALGVVVVFLLFKQKFTGENSLSHLYHQLQNSKNVIAGEYKWLDKKQWLNDNLPNYSSDSAASAVLLDHVDSIAKIHGVEIVSRELIDVQKAHFDRAGLQLELKGDTRSMVEVIHQLQVPKSFIGVDDLVVEPLEFSQGVRCELKVNHWYLVL